MEFQNIDPEELEPIKDNPKHHPGKQIQKLKSSIEDFGFINPILFFEEDGKKKIVAGHARQKAAIDKELDEVPSIKLDFDPKQARAYNITDNKIAELSEWDEEMLLENLQDIEDLETGFEDDEIEDMNPEVELFDVNLDEEEETNNKCPKCGFEW